MNEPIEDPRAKDLLRQKAIEPMDVVGHWLVHTLHKRAWRRPVGSSARLFKGMHTDDPFAPPSDFVDPGPRALYVAERFVRIDKASRGKDPTKVGQRVPAWVEQMQKEREQRDKTPHADAKGKKPLPKKPTPKGPQPKGPQPTAKGPAMQHTPAFGAAAPPPVDRTPPRIEHQAAPPRPKLVRPPPSTPPRPPPAEVPSEAAPVDRTPPKVTPQPVRPRMATGKPAAPANRPKNIDPNIDRTPPMVAHVVKDSKGEPLRPHRDVRAEKAKGGALGGTGEVRRPPPSPPPKPAPPRPQATPPKAQATPQPPPAAQATPKPAETPRPPAPRPPPSSSGGMDDLFGGPTEGRAKIGARPRKTVESVPEEPKAPAAAAPPIDRAPPLLRDAKPKSSPEADAEPAAAKPAAARPAPVPAPTPTPPPAPPKEAAPPKPATAPKPAAPLSSGGLDDLFGGGPPADRPKMAPRLKKTVVAVPDEPPPPKPAEAVDRAPPLIQNVDPKKLPK